MFVLLCGLCQSWSSCTLHLPMKIFIIIIIKISLGNYNPRLSSSFVNTLHTLLSQVNAHIYTE